MRKRNAIISSAAVAGIILLSGGCASLSGLASKSSQEEAGRVSGNAGNGHGSERSRLEEKGGSTSSSINLSGGIEPAGDIYIDERETLDSLQKGLIETARKKIGCRYSYSAQGPDRFDCSGLMLYVFKQFGISLPHSSQAQYSAGRAIKEGAPLKPGDLVFFSGSKVSKTTVGHVGMVIDYDKATHEFTFIHAAMTGVELQKSTSEYYAKRYIGARRIL